MSFFVAALAASGLVLLFSGLTRPAPITTRTSPLEGLNRLAREAGYRRIAGPGLLGLCLAGGAAAYLVGSALTTLVPLQVGSLIAGIVYPLIRARVRRDAQRNALRHAWPDALADIISGVRAGVSLAECCSALAHRGPTELRDAFAAFSTTYVASGSFDAALTRLQEHLEDPVGDRVVAILRMTHEVGGNDLVRVLRTSAELIREDLRVRGEIRARWSWTITAARLAAAAPFLILVTMGTRPEATAAYTSEAGTLTILAGAAATFVGYRLMLRAAKLPEESRLR